MVNDAFGHSQGDNLLREAGKIIKQNIRTYDIAARLGGDEFAVMFPETSSEQARVVAERIKSCVEKALKRYGDSLTLSIGVLTIMAPKYPVEEIIKIADNLMYSVKNSSKNSIAYQSVG